MLKATRILRSKLPVRPVLNINPSTPQPSSKPGSSPNSDPKNPPNGMQVSPIGLGFILGGLALGVYMFKPNKRPPTAAMDTFKPQIAIVFGLGDSKDTFRATASKLGFAYINVRTDLKKLDELVKSGTTKFFIEGFADVAELDELASNTVQPDTILTFQTSKPLNDVNSRQVNLPDPSYETIVEVLSQRNLV